MIPASPRGLPPHLPRYASASPATLREFARAAGLLLATVFCGVACAPAQGGGDGVTSAPAALPALPDLKIPGTPAGQSTNGSEGSNPQQTLQTQTGAPRRADQERNAQRTAELASPVTEPTQFQRLVTETTGLELPIFGASLFRQVPSTFAPVQDVPVNSEYVIGPGDTLRLSLFGQVNRQQTVTVDRNGDIAIPDVGPVHVAGVRYGDLSGFLKTQLGSVFRNFDLTVNLSQLRSIQVFVVGDARFPGAYTVSSLSTLLNAIFESGGPLPTGSLRNIQLQRGHGTVVHFDLYDLLLHGDKSGDVALQPGDVIFIPPVGQQAAISGSVTTPAIYEIKPETTVAQLIQLAGGETSVALNMRIRLERIYEHTMRYLEDVEPASEGSIPLRDGDVLTIGSIVDRYRDAVTLRGNVAYPGRYVWKPGMRVLDLAPNRDELITRAYYRRRNGLGSPNAPASAGAQPGSLQVAGNGIGQASDQAVRNGAASNPSSTTGGGSVGTALTASNNVFPPSNDVLLSAPDIDWSYAVVERLDQKTLKTSLIPFNPGKLYLDGDQSQNILLESGDVVTFFSTADVKVPTSQQTRFVRLEGEFAASGVYSVEPGETLRHLLARAGGFTPEAYLYGSEFTRESTRRVQQQRLNEYADNLEAEVSLYSSAANSRAVSDRDAAAAGAAVSEARQAVARLRQIQPQGRIVLQLKPDSRSIDSIPDLPLEDGDRFVVPRIPSTVNVEGQVYSANAFVFERNQRAIAYLRKAGGPDRQADRKRIFLLRADGSVYSRQYGDVERANIFPGDTLVVPPQIDRRAILRDLIDISTVVGQFGIGAAAIDLLR